MPRKAAPKPDWRSFHLWQIQPIRDLLVIAAVLAVLYLGRVLQFVTVPILLALLLAYLFEPVVQLMTRARRISRQFAAIAIIVAVALLILLPAGLGGGFALSQGIGFTRRVAANAERVVRLCDAFSESPQQDEPDFDAWITTAAPESAQTLYENLDGPNWEHIASFAASRYDPADFAFIRSYVENNTEAILAQSVGTGTDALQALLRTISSLFTLAFGLFLTAFFFFFLSTSYARVLAFLAKLIPENNRERTIDLITKMDRVVAGFIRGRLTIAVIQSIVFAVAYLAIGVPAALLLGVIVGFLSIVPYLAIAGLIASMIMLGLEPPEGFRGSVIWILIAPPVVYVIGQALDDYIWTPLIQGKQTGMDTPTVLFASIAGGILGGIYGLLIAIPVAACIKILLQEVFWPRFKCWAEGDAEDPLPLGASSDNDT